MRAVVVWAVWPCCWDSHTEDTGTPPYRCRSSGGDGNAAVSYAPSQVWSHRTCNKNSNAINQKITLKKSLMNDNFTVVSMIKSTLKAWNGPIRYFLKWYRYESPPPPHHTCSKAPTFVSSMSALYQLVMRHPPPPPPPHTHTHTLA